MASLALVSRDPQPLYRPTLLAPSSPQAAEATQVGDIPTPEMVHLNAKRLQVGPL